jgi:hypothetical protein
VSSNLTREQAETFTMPTGQHAGRTLLDIDLSGDRQFIRWVAATWTRHDHQRIREHALAYVRFHPTTPKRKRELSSANGGGLPETDHHE